MEPSYQIFWVFLSLSFIAVTSAVDSDHDKNCFSQNGFFFIKSSIFLDRFFNRFIVIFLIHFDNNKSKMPQMCFLVSFLWKIWSLLPNLNILKLIHDLMVKKIMKYAFWGQRKNKNKLIPSFLARALRDIIELKTKIYHTVWLGNMWHCFFLTSMGHFWFKLPNLTTLMDYQIWQCS